MYFRLIDKNLKEYRKCDNVYIIQEIFCSPFSWNWGNALHVNIEYVRELKVQILVPFLTSPKFVKMPR